MRLNHMKLLPGLAYPCKYDARAIKEKKKSCEAIVHCLLRSTSSKSLGQLLDWLLPERSLTPISLLHDYLRACLEFSIQALLHTLFEQLAVILKVKGFITDDKVKTGEAKISGYWDSVLEVIWKDGRVQTLWEAERTPANNP